MEPVSREEFKDSIIQQSEYLKDILDRGFTGLNKRMDIANGRTSKLEERVGEAERSVAVLLDRAAQAEAKVGKSKWWATGAAGAVIGVIEALKFYFSRQ